METNPSKHKSPWNMSANQTGFRRKTASIVLYAFSIGMVIISSSLYRNAEHEKQKVIAEKEQQLLRAELILESDGRATIMCDEDGVITYSTASAERFFGWTHDELQGKPSTMLIPEESVAIHNEKMKLSSDTMRQFPGNYKMTRSGLEADGLHRNGNLIPLVLDTRVIKYGDTIEYIVQLQRRNNDRIIKRGAKPAVEIQKLELPKDLPLEF
jgi:PAS domain S-box-containing protein